MVTVAEFVLSPSVELLEQCTKEQLLEIGAHYGVDVDARRSKENVKVILVTNLVEKGVFAAKPVVPSAAVSGSPLALTFEQQKELLIRKRET